MPRAEPLGARPLAGLALAAIGGIAAADALASLLSSWFWLGAAALAGARMIRGQRPAQFMLLTGCVFACRHAVICDAVGKSELRFLLEERAQPLDVTAEGRVIKPLRRDLPGTEPGQALFVAESLAAPLIGKAWTGPVQLRLITGEAVDLAPGRYQIAGRAFLPRPPDNPGQFDERSFDLRHGFVAALRVRETAELEADAWNLAAWLDRHAQRSREWMKSALDRGMRGDEAAHKIILATVLGGAEAEARDLEQPFRVTGTLHIFAVSGLHVGIVGWILWRLFKPLGLSRGWMALIVSLLLFGYAFLTGLRPSTVRAAVMAVVLLSGELWQRRSDMLNSLGAAALLLLIADSNQLFSIGFQLSFSVITAIALLNRPILGAMRPLTEPDAFMPEVLLNQPQRLVLVLRRWLAAAVSISAVSWVGSLPFTVRHFHLATPIALVANILLVPVAFLILFTTILSLGAALVHLPLVPLWLGNANWFFARGAILFAQTFAMIPGGNFYLDLPALRLRPPVELTVLRLRAGGGAQHLRTSSSDWLFDCGAAKDYDFLLRPYLNAAAVNRVDGLVLSHADAEHIGAAPFVVRDYHPDRILLSALETGSRSSSLRQLRAMGVPPGKISLGDRLDFGGKAFPASAEVRFPPQSLRVSHADDRPLVLRLDIGPFRILWCNDAGFTAEKYIVEKLPADSARCDVLIRNQHPNDTSMNPEFLDRANPRLVISSNNTFPESQKLPQRIRDACAARKIALLDQAATGAVILRFWPQRLEVVPFRAPAETITLAPRQDASR